MKKKTHIFTVCFLLLMNIIKLRIICAEANNVTEIYYRMAWVNENGNPLVTVNSSFEGDCGKQLY